ncbi:MAG: hypothetical protein HQK61_11590 [Desulfamplus sp.]|nr:hypothetical protein [Desulfamplus sp.]
MGIKKMYVKRSLGRVDTGYYVIYTGVTGSVWRRQYWNESGKSWSKDHPNLRIYKTYKKISRELLKKIIKNGGGTTKDYNRIWTACETLKTPQIMKEDYVQRAKEDIADITARVGGKWGATDLLREIIELEYKYPKPDMAARVEIYEHQRSLIIKAAKHQMRYN